MMSRIKKRVIKIVCRLACLPQLRSLLMSIPSSSVRRLSWLLLYHSVDGLDKVGSEYYTITVKGKHVPAGCTDPIMDT